ncbi:molybdenum cofactor cytidylyltransferase [Cryobacterium luteum]|nr:molybdenum cofactor cytidylyltransferase [Cryobacterium luteum]
MADMQMPPPEPQSAGTAGTPSTAGHASTGSTAETAKFASTASTAGTAETAGTPSTAGHASTGSTAGTGSTAETAEFARTASTAGTAGTTRIAGLVLAAGAGYRYGMPKALVHDAAGRSWLQNAVDVLAAAGCSPVIVVLGARGAEAAALLQAGDDDLAARKTALSDSAPAGGMGQLSASVLVVQAADWAEGLSASLRAGLRCALDQPDLAAIAVIPVDVPDLNAATVARVVSARTATTDAPGAPASMAAVTHDTLRQARFAGRPGHPVVIGRSHWAVLIETVTGDTGARPYLRAHTVEQIECGDLGTGVDVDQPR